MASCTNPMSIVSALHYCTGFCAYKVAHIPVLSHLRLLLVHVLPAIEGAVLRGLDHSVEASMIAFVTRRICQSKYERE